MAVQMTVVRKVSFIQCSGEQRHQMLNEDVLEDGLDGGYMEQHVFNISTTRKDDTFRGCNKSSNAECPPDTRWIAFFNSDRLDFKYPHSQK
ncbi:hypothetical protein TNCV_261611 [Trichonephila clavipes]|nr:hypothetical protein TNCV_261611 [Trichonephila clavipes]